VKITDEGVTFRWKDYRRKGAERKQVMTLAPEEFMRRFLLHILPPGFHRIPYYGLFSNGRRKASLARCRNIRLGSAAMVCSVSATALNSRP
jgi:hypothetical protein